MPSYHDALYAAREAVRDGYQARMDALRADEARERLIAQAWEARPGETTWRSFLAELNEGLPPGAQVKYGTARRYEREGAAKIGRYRGSDGGRHRPNLEEGGTPVASDGHPGGHIQDDRQLGDSPGLLAGAPDVW